MTETYTKKVLGAADYIVFVVMLLLSVAIGVFFAIKDRRNKHGAEGYLLGARKLSFWPISASLALSMLSSVSVLGIPAELYMFGSMYTWILLTFLVCFAVVILLYIPLYHSLKLKSCFEYLKIRFNNKIRLLSIAAHIIQSLMYIGIMIYAPSVAIATVTTFNLWACIVVTGLACTLYTTLGGLKAVVWTDVFQAVVLFIGIMVTLFSAVETDKVGSWSNVWRANRESGRFDFFRFDIDPRYRHTFWSLLFGLAIFWTSIYTTAQFQVQRYLCCRTMRDAQKGVLASIVVTYGAILPIFFLGWVMYAYFENCDPLMRGIIASPDQLLPLMVMEIFENRPGLPGLFIASLFAACISTVSSGINAMSSITVQDLIRPFKKHWKENTFIWLSKGFTILYGLLCTAFACLATQLGGVLQASLSVLGIVGGPLLGVFTLGIIFPCVNWIGAGIGFILGLVLPVWIYVGSQSYPVIKYNPQYYRFKPRNISECRPANFTPPVFPVLDRPAIADDLYTVSYAYYCSIGLGATLFVGLAVTAFTYRRGDTKKIDPKLVRPIFDSKIFCWLPKSVWCWCGVDRDNETIKELSFTTSNSKNLPTVATLSDSNVQTGNANPSFSID